MSQTKELLERELFDQIKSLQSFNSSSREVAEKLELELEVVNNAFGVPDYGKYMLMNGEEYQELSLEKVSPAQSGYYRGLVAQKHEENGRLKETRGWLMEQVYFLRKAVSFLEVRKRELEDGIKGLERNINIGIATMEQLEDNNNFQNISAKTAKKNK